MKLREVAALLTVVAVCGLVGIGIGRSYFSEQKVASSPSIMPVVAPSPKKQTPTTSQPENAVPENSSGHELSLQEALAGERIPNEVSQELTIVTVSYWSFDDREHTGQIVVRKNVAEEVKEIFDDLWRARFPIDKVVPISQYDWSDEQSMSDDNTSAFNYRRIENQDALSKHSYGLAIDINPRLNPYIRDGVTRPAGANYDPSVPGTITADGPVVEAFRKRGWVWGGRWRKLKDWQHFEKPF